MYSYLSSYVEKLIMLGILRPWRQKRGFLPVCARQAQQKDLPLMKNFNTSLSKSLLDCLRNIGALNYLRKAVQSIRLPRKSNEPFPPRPAFWPTTSSRKRSVILIPGWTLLPSNAFLMPPKKRASRNSDRSTSTSAKKSPTKRSASLSPACKMRHKKNDARSVNITLEYFQSPFFLVYYVNRPRSN